ncbi:MAG: transglutaminase domain-containing protein [Phycisphaerales bacterium]|nr:transglutaminase domain-containing protein [Phycisphaerales bacterium]
MSRFMRSVSCLAAVVFAALAARGAAPGAAPGTTEERWHVVEMMGAKAGWMRSATSTGADGLLRFESEMHFHIGRGPVNIEVRVETAFVETADGRPVSMRVVQEFGPTPAIAEYEFKADHVLVRNTQGGRTMESHEAPPGGDWLTPRRAEEDLRRRIAAGEKQIRQSVLDPSTGLRPIEVTRVRKGDGAVEAMGKSVAATEWVVTQSVYPGIETIEWLDRDGRLVRGSVDMGGIAMEILASERELALAESAPPELLASTLVRPNRRIEDPRSVSRGVYIVSVPDGSLPDFPSAGAQVFERIDERTARVTVDVSRVDAAEPGAERAAYLASSSMIGADDPEVAKFAVVARGDEAEKAEALRRRVHGHIDQKSLDVGLASASDVVRTRQGDCTEHAVLLAAALRAAGIPCGVAAGGLSIDEFLGAVGVFGYHMWTQALLPLEGGGWAWVDVDATMGDGSAYDAAHIAMDVSALADGDLMNSLAALAPLMGRLRVEVVEVESAGVGAGAP